VKIKGKVWKFGKDVDTDELFAARFLMGGDETSATNYQQFIGTSGMIDAGDRENVPPNFLSEVQPGDVIVGEENFGIGSSRQQAAETLKFKGVRAIVADSIHRIFFRNYWNLGCPAIDLREGIINNLTTGKEFRFQLTIPPWFIDMVEAGGLISYHKALKG